jgi:hypothetical protein
LAVAYPVFWKVEMKAYVSISLKWAMIDMCNHSHRALLLSFECRRKFSLEKSSFLSQQAPSLAVEMIVITPTCAPTLTPCPFPSNKQPSKTIHWRVARKYRLLSALDNSSLACLPQIFKICGSC